MSLSAIVWAWKQQVESPIRKLVLLHLADSAGEETGESWYSMTSMAERCECNRSSVVRHLKTLQEMGLITLVERGHSGGKSNRFRVNFNAQPSGTEPLRTKQLGAQSHQSGGTEPPDVGAQSNTPSGTVHLQPTNEPKTKPVIEPKRKKKSERAEDSYLQPDWMDADKWRKYLVTRREKGRPMNHGALDLVVESIAESHAAGIPLDVIFKKMIMAGWQTCKESYFEDWKLESKNSSRHTGFGEKNYEDTGGMGFKTVGGGE